MENNNPLLAVRNKLALAFACLTVLAVGYRMISWQPVEGSLRFSTHADNANRMDKNSISEEPKSTLGKAGISETSFLSTGDSVDMRNAEINERSIEIPAGRLDSGKNASGVLSTKVSGFVTLPETSSQKNSLRPSAALSQTIATSYDIEVPPGVSVPAVLAEPSAKSALDPISQEEAQSMADTFLSTIDEQIQAGIPRDSAWEKLQKRSDDAFRARYGWEAFNTESAKANEQATVSH